MAGPYITFPALKIGRDVQRIVARLLRFWDARNVKKGGQLMSVDLLLIDEKSTVMHGTIHIQHLPKFDVLLKEGSLYVITAFEVTRSNPRFKLTDFHLSIRFNAATTLVEIEDSVCTIPKQLFRFRTHQELIALANTNNDLPDVIGEVCGTSAYRSEGSQKLERILVHLSLESGEKVRLSAFDSHATILSKKLEKKAAGACVILATNINPKFFGGQLYLNATSATKFLFDSETEATQAFLTSLHQEGSPSTGKYRGVQKIEQASIAELNDFVLTSTTQEAEFLCTAKVADIQSSNGWSYISCSKCGKKMTKNHSSLTCNHCHTSGAIGNVRYRVEMVVHDGTTSAVFVVFDKDMVKLTNAPTTTLSAEMADADPDLETTNTIPSAIHQLIGSTYTFHVKLTSFNFTPHHKSFTVSRIFDHPPVAQQPTFADEGRRTRSIEIAAAAEAASKQIEQEIQSVTPTSEEGKDASSSTAPSRTNIVTSTPKKPKLH